MRRLLASMGLAGVLVSGTGSLALGAVSTTQHLPAAARDRGTMNAHAHVPTMTGSGKMTPDHMATPGTANVAPCGHGG